MGFRNPDAGALLGPLRLRRDDGEVEFLREFEPNSYRLDRLQTGGDGAEILLYSFVLLKISKILVL